MKRADKPPHIVAAVYRLCVFDDYAVVKLGSEKLLYAMDDDAYPFVDQCSNQ